MPKGHEANAVAGHAGGGCRAIARHCCSICSFIRRFGVRPRSREQCRRTQQAGVHRIWLV
jgi:hypothetical protein